MTFPVTGLRLLHPRYPSGNPCWPCVGDSWKSWLYPETLGSSLTFAYLPYQHTAYGYASVSKTMPGSICQGFLCICALSGQQPEKCLGCRKRLSRHSVLSSPNWDFFLHTEPLVMEVALMANGSLMSVWKMRRHQLFRTDPSHWL